MTGGEDRRERWARRWFAEKSVKHKSGGVQNSGS